jgi:hypothetical protein
MKLLDTYHGGDDEFEGDHTVTLRALPAGALIRRAIITLTPAQPATGTQFEEILSFTDSPGDWGVTRNSSSAGRFVEVDFHARRTLVMVTGSNLPGTNLQVDLGGTYVELNDRGAIRAPDDQRFVLPNDGRLPGLMVNKFKLSRPEGNTPQIESVTIRSVPTNLSVRLGQMPAFWTRLGELTAAESSPDFAAVLTAFLATAAVEQGYYALPFVIHSDTIARLDVTVEIDYIMQQAVLPPHLPEVTLPYTFSTQPGISPDLLTVNLPRQALPIAGLTGAQIRGEFQPTRIAAGPIGQEPESLLVVASPMCSLAQPLHSEIEIEVSGIDLPLANTQPGLAGMHISIQSDADGKPSGQTLATAAVRVEKPLPGQSSWGSASLPTPFRVVPGGRYWIILQSQVGEAYWRSVIDAAAVHPLQCSRDAGLSWRVAATPGAIGPLSALFRLRHTPERFTVPVQLQIGSGPEAIRRRLDEFAPLGRIEFSFDFADALGQYLAHPAIGSACGSGELLHNGGFDQPPHTDATRLLFGFDVGRSTMLQGEVDLSRGVNLNTRRYLRLSIDDQPAIRIDCAGADPGRTTLNEIVAAINSAARQQIASALAPGITGDPRRVLQLERSASRSDALMLLPWCEDSVPEGWTRPPDSDGTISRIKLPALAGNRQGSKRAQPERIVAALETRLPKPVIIAQRLPVSAGCTYALRLGYESFRSMQTFEAIFGLSADSDEIDHRPAAAPRWQVRWLGFDGQIVAQEQAELVSTRSLEGNQTNFGRVEERLIAPAQAMQAELRLIQPALGLLLLEDVSFAPVLDAAVNGDFRRWAQACDACPRLPVGWTDAGGWIDQGIATDKSSLAVELRGDGLEDAVLSQVVAVSGAELYQLQVRARPEAMPTADPATQPVQQRARLELRWLAAAPIGTPLLLPLDGSDFPLRVWAGAAPADAQQAEIRLIQPLNGGRLSVESVSLSRVEQVAVPLVFLSEAPGDLTVSQLRVAYDLPAPPIESARAARSRAQAQPAIQPFSAGRHLSHHSPLAEHSIADISGASARLVQRLLDARPPITTIAELAAVDLAVTIPQIPAAELQELKTKAEMVLSVQVAVESFDRLAETSLETIVALPLAELARRANHPTAPAEQLQRSLRALRLLLKNTAFRSLRVSDLAAGRA